MTAEHHITRHCPQQSDRITLVMHDRAVVNSVAMCTISVLYPHTLMLGVCLTYLIHVGEQMQTPV